MGKIKYTLPFVNKGKEFEIPNWTVEKHEHAMVRTTVALKENKMSEIEKDNALKYFIILETLQEVDANVTIENVKDFFTHPENIVEFFNAVYSAGKHDIHFHKGDKKTPKKTKKDTTKRN